MSTADVQRYLDHGFRIVTWPQIGDTKGPREEGWPRKIYTLADYHDGYRVGLLTGVEIAPGKFFHDTDIDWAPGTLIAQALLPPTEFVFGRASKKVSHCCYTLPEPLTSYRYEDIDKSCLIELRGTKVNGEIGMQTMVPPSIWTKNGIKEALAFIKAGMPTHLESASAYKQRVCLSAVGMMLAKHLGINGFGHEIRLMWAGYLLRIGIDQEDLIRMGEAMSVYCQNREVKDVRQTIVSTAVKLAEGTKQKVKGGPAFAKAMGTNGKAIIARINEWLGKDSDFIRDQHGMILPKNQFNVRRAIELLGHELTYNQFSDKLLLNGKPMEDLEIDSVELQIDTEYHFQPPEKFFQKVLKHVAWLNGFHPVKLYLDALEWDQTPRLDTWLIVAAKAEDSPYTRAISSIMAIAAVRRIRFPGCKYDEMVVLENSLQGTDKSSAVQALCPNPAWFSDDLPLNVKSQQLIEATLGKWIVEASDLAGKRKTEIEQLKAMMSRQVDGPARMAYAHFPVERPRHFILLGTTNSAAYLTDPTGARRFWPVAVKRFNVAWIKANRDQLWAEACVRETAGESIRLPEALWPAAAEHQEARREVDPWEVVLRRMLLAIEPTRDGKRRVVTGALWDALGIVMERRDRYGSLRIADIMQRFGFVRTRIRPPGEEVQVGYVQETDVLDLREDGAGREVGEDDVPI